MTEEACEEEKQWVYVDKPESFLLSKFEDSLGLFSSKIKEESKEAYHFTKDILNKDKLDKWIMSDIIQNLIPYLDTARKPIEKEYSLILLSIIADKYPEQIKTSLPSLVPVVSNLFWDTKPVVQNTAKAVLADIIKCSGNTDLDPFLEVVLTTFEDPTTTAEAVEKLAGCVFVQNVECAAISIIEPILNRGLRDKTNEVKRKSCIIIDNMCKLVEHPKEILPLVSKIQPLSRIKCAENISDPEARSIAEKALNTLKNSYGETTRLIEKTYEEILRT